MNAMVDPQVSSRGNAKPLNVIFPIKDGQSSNLVTREELTKADILVVGHDISFREYLANLLGQFWNVAVAINGLHALDMIRRRKFDLILSDAWTVGQASCILQYRSSSTELFLLQVL